VYSLRDFSASINTDLLLSLVAAAVAVGDCVWSAPAVDSAFFGDGASGCAYDKHK